MAISSADRTSYVNAAGESVLIFAKTSQLHKRGGGVCACICKDITFTVLKDISHLSDNYFNSFWLKLQCRKL